MWWNRFSEAPLFVLSLAFLAAYSVEVLRPNLSSGWHTVCEVTQDFAWGAFIVDYIWRLHLAKDRAHYFVRHLFDLAIIALPALRPLRLLRVLMLLRVVSRSAAGNLRGSLAPFIVSTTVLLGYCASLAVLQAERGVPGARIHSFGEATWWAITTMTTVGYGDYYPVTTEGRFIAGGLMISGIALIGLVTASFASWLVGRVRKDAEELEAATRRDLTRLSDQLDRIERRLDAMDATAEHTTARNSDLVSGG